MRVFVADVARRMLRHRVAAALTCTFFQGRKGRRRAALDRRARLADRRPRTLDWNRCRRQRRAQLRQLARQRERSRGGPRFPEHRFAHFPYRKPGSATMRRAVGNFHRVDALVRPADLRGDVAQLGERLNGIQEVDGSIPFVSTTRTHLRNHDLAVLSLLPPNPTVRPKCLIACDCRRSAPRASSASTSMPPTASLSGTRRAVLTAATGHA